MYSFKHYCMAEFRTPSKSKMLRPMIISLLGLLISRLCSAQNWDARGATGVQGAPGATGSSGSPGHPGYKGQTGATGATGTAGYSGATGNTGPRGEKGLTGVPATVAGGTGATGMQGPQGPTGVRGHPAVIEHSTVITRRAKGPRGPPGPVGHPGFPGSPGRPGPPGTIPVIDCSLYGPRRLQMEEEGFSKGLVNSYTLATVSIALCVVSLKILLATFVYTSSKSRQLWKRLHLLQTR